MSGRTAIVVKDAQEIVMIEGAFPFSGKGSDSFAAFESASDEQGFPVFPNIGEEGFELLANTREVRVNRRRFDVVGHEYNVEG